jgi:excisionase family DNA binding protein
MSVQSAGLSEESALRPITPKEAARILNCNPKTLYAALQRGEIPSIKIGRLRLIPRPVFERLLRGEAA